MIIGHIRDIRKYAGILPCLEEGMKACEKAADLPAGRYEFEGGYFMIQEGQTRPMDHGTYESHRSYIDVQILLEGQEEIAWNTLDQLTVCEPYDEKTDKERYTGEDHYHMTIRKDMFWAAFPEDGHKALGTLTEPGHFRKIVMKLPVQRGV